MLAALKGEEKSEATQRDEEARVWISGLEAVSEKMGVRCVYDLSATPFFLKGSGYPEGTLFPWVVSDFSLIDAIEAGLAKIPRVPVDDNTGQPVPTYRNLWLRIRDDLPKKGRRAEAMDPVAGLPAPLEGALHSLFSDYEKAFIRWRARSLTDGGRSTPPVFIVVCNNTTVSKMVFDYVAGWSKPQPDGSESPVPGKLELFSNVEHGRWLPRARTILVDSSQLESGEAMSPEFKKIAATEIAEFKAEYTARFPGRDADDLTDEDLLREAPRAGSVVEGARLGPGARGSPLHPGLNPHLRPGSASRGSALGAGWTDDVRQALHDAGIAAGLLTREVRATVGSGLRAGTAFPRDPGARSLHAG